MFPDKTGLSSRWSLGHLSRGQGWGLGGGLKSTICKQHIPGNLVSWDINLPCCFPLGPTQPRTGRPSSLSRAPEAGGRERISKSFKSCSEQEHFKNQREEAMRRTVSSQSTDFWKPDSEWLNGLSLKENGLGLWGGLGPCWRVSESADLPRHQ